MNQIISKLILAGDKCVPEMHLRQPGFTYSACGPFIKHKQRIEKFMQTGDTNYIYKNGLYKEWKVKRLRKMNTIIQRLTKRNTIR